MIGIAQQTQKLIGFVEMIFGIPEYQGKYRHVSYLIHHLTKNQRRRQNQITL